MPMPSPVERYVAKVFDFDANQDPASFEERTGPPKELPAVIGMISMSFQVLENELSQRIGQMLSINKRLGEIVVSELSFRNKLNVFSSLYYELKSRFHFNCIPEYEDEYFRELMKALIKCETLRNQSLHSEYLEELKSNLILRKKSAARIRKGFSTTREPVEISYLYNISDYMICMAMELDQMFIDFGPLKDL